MRCRGGFTLVELMIVVAMLGILSAIAIPQFANVIRKSQEGKTKANLGVLRSAISIYYSDLEGWYPTDNLASLMPKYLLEIPMKYTPPYHPIGNVVQKGDDSTWAASTGDWFYWGTAYDPKWGTVIVNCIHHDLKGNPWSSY